MVVSESWAFTLLCAAILYRPIALTVFKLLLGGAAMRLRAAPRPLLYPLASIGNVSVARTGLSKRISWMLLLNHEPSHATRIIPWSFIHSAAAVRSFARLSRGTGSWSATLNANEAPLTSWPVLLVELNAKLKL